MPKPFQFSIRRLLAATDYFSIAAGSFAVILHPFGRSPTDGQIRSWQAK
jgi:hypothetical protein